MKQGFGPKRIGRTGLIFLAVATILWLGAGSAFAGQNVEIKDPARIADLTSLNAEIYAIGSAVTSCMQGGKSNKDCMCENEEKISHFNRTVKRLFTKYPDLKKDSLVHFQTSKGTINLNLSGIRRRAELKLQCDQ